jgi:hypothetical protein
MMTADQQETQVLPMASPSEPDERLPYCVELWDAQNHDATERVLARAANASLAHAVFKAAQDEHPERRITLRRGARIIADSVG